MKKIISQKGILRLMIASIAIIFAACSTMSSQKSGAEFLGNVDRGFLSNLVWSPAGESIAVSSHNDGTNSSKIYLLDLETQEFHKILESTYGPITVTGWSPDGKQILFISDEGGKGTWMYDVDGGASTQFLADGDFAAWSPNGDKAAVFKILRNASHWDISLHIVSLDLSDDQIIYSTKGKYVQGLSWSPDGKRLVFAFSPEAKLDRVDIFVLNTADGKVEQLTTSGRNISPVWSPNSEVIAYIAKEVESKSQLLIYDLNKRCAGVLSNARNPAHPAWSPDGRYIAFISDFKGIYKVDVLSENALPEGCR